MNPTLVRAAAPSVLPSAPRHVRWGRLVWLIAGAACVLMVVLNVFWRQSYTGDEGFYGVTAENMLRSPTYLLRPSYFPAGSFLADRNGFAHPPFNSYLYAASLWLSRGALAGPVIVNGLALAALLFLAYRVLALTDRDAGLFAVLLLAASPAIMRSYSELEAEPLLTTFGLASLYCCLRGGFAPGGRRWLFAGGLALGMAFALKLWLVGPLGLAVAVALGFGLIAPGVRWRDAAAGLGLFAGAFLLPAASHLAAIAWVYPQDLGFWLRKIYFGVFTGAGISGDKLGGVDTPAQWVHPVWYYAAALYRDHFFLVPPILFGAGSLWRDRGAGRRTLWAVLAGIAGVVPLSLIKVKEPMYVLSCAVGLYLLAGASLAAVVRHGAPGDALDRWSRRAGLVVTAGLLVLFPLAYLRHIQPDKITLLFVVAHTLVFGVYLAVFLAIGRRRSAGTLRGLVGAAAVAAVVLLTGWKAATDRPRDPTIAGILKPCLAANAPGELSFIASNFKDYQYYTYHRGMYWHELPAGRTPAQIMAEPKYRHVVAFILGPKTLAKPAERSWVAWLEKHATDRTPELDRRLGTVSGYRVFTRSEATRSEAMR